MNCYIPINTNWFWHAFKLKTKNSVRRAIDLAMLQILEITGNHNEILDSAYKAVAEQITTLATLMKKGQTEE